MEWARPLKSSVNWLNMRFEILENIFLNIWKYSKTFQDFKIFFQDRKSEISPFPGTMISYGKKLAGSRQRGLRSPGSVRLQKLEKTWNKLEKSGFLSQFSTLNLKNQIYMNFDYFDFWSLRLDAQISDLAPRMRFPGSGFWVTENW